MSRRSSLKKAEPEHLAESSSNGECPEMSCECPKGRVPTTYAPQASHGQERSQGSDDIPLSDQKAVPETMRGSRTGLHPEDMQKVRGREGVEFRSHSDLMVLPVEETKDAYLETGGTAFRVHLDRNDLPWIPEVLLAERTDVQPDVKELRSQTAEDVSRETEVIFQLPSIKPNEGLVRKILDVEISRKIDRIGMEVSDDWGADGKTKYSAVTYDPVCKGGEEVSNNSEMGKMKQLEVCRILWEKQDFCAKGGKMEKVSTLP